MNNQSLVFFVNHNICYKIKEVTMFLEFQLIEEKY